MPTEYQTDDLPIEPPAEADYEEIASGIYAGRLIGFRQVEKPAWKIQAEIIRKPEKEPDKLQWQWSFEALVEGVAMPVSDFTNRSWHSRSKAAAFACALLDVALLPIGAGLSTQKLVGRPCQIWIIEKPREDGSTRSYIDKVLPVPKKRSAAASAPVPAAAEERVNGATLAEHQEALMALARAKMAEQAQQAPTFAEAAQRASRGPSGPSEAAVQEAVVDRQAAMAGAAEEPPDDLDYLASLDPGPDAEA